MIRGSHSIALNSYFPYEVLVAHLCPSDSLGEPAEIRDPSFSPHGVLFTSSLEYPNSQEDLRNTP